jgi:hypothetical protein
VGPGISDGIEPVTQLSVEQAFVEHALKLVHFKIAFLLPLGFNETEERDAVLDQAPLARVWHFRHRPTCPPGIDKVTKQVVDIGRDHDGALLVPKDSGGSYLYAWSRFPHFVSNGLAMQGIGPSR